MFDKETIALLQQGPAIEQARNSMQTVTNAGVIALPDNFKTFDIETYLPFRRRARGSMTTVSDEDFATYVKAHKEPGAAVFVDEKAMTATAILNLGTPDEPGHTDNRAVLAPPKTAAYLALLAIADGRGKPQKAIAEFLEDWQDDIRCDNSEGIIPIHQAVAAMRALTIDALRKVTAEEQKLSAARSTFESIAASSKEPIPTTVSFTCSPHAGMNERTFVMRLGILTGSDDPMPVLRIIKKEVHDEQMGQELAERVRDAVTGEEITVAVGTYAAK